LRCRTAEKNTSSEQEGFKGIMTGFSVLRSRPAGTLATAGGADYTVGAALSAGDGRRTAGPCSRDLFDVRRRHR
jgi:hypothetical protein